MIAYLYKSNHTIKLLKRFSFVKTDPKCGPTLLLKISILTNLSIIWGCFHQSDSLFRQFLFEGDFYRFFSIYSYVNSCPLIPIVARPFPRGSWFEQTWIYSTWGPFHTSFSFLGLLVSGKKILHIPMKKSNPNCGPMLLRGFEQT